MNEWILLSLVMITEAFLHYFPWAKLLKGRELPHLMAYVLGVMGLMVPFTVWLIEQNESVIVTVLWKVIAGGGITVIVLYGLDRYIELEWRDMEASERERQNVQD